MLVAAASGPGVRNSGALTCTSLRTVRRTVACIGVSIAVPHTSPSPWAAWPSPSENRAPGDRPVDLIDPGEVKVRQVCERRARGDLAARGVQGVELHNRPAGDGCDGLDGSVPGEVELIASDVHRGG